MLKLLGEINQKLTQTINSHSESIAKIEAHEEEPSPIYWPPQQQYQEEPFLLLDSKMLNLMREIEKTSQIMKSQQEQYTPQFFAEIDAKIEAHVEQIINYLNREEEELQSQLVTNLDGHYMVDESPSYHEQDNTTLKNGEVVKTHMKNRKEEQIEAPKALHRAKGEEVSIEAPSSSTLILETPYEPRTLIPSNLKISFLETDNTLLVIIAYDLTRGEEGTLLGLFEKQKETIKVEKFLEYSPHFTPVHNSLSDEKLFENTQKDLPRYVDIQNYLSVGKIYSL
jgi:hypothetical protein